MKNTYKMRNSLLFGGGGNSKVRGGNCPPPPPPPPKALKKTLAMLHMHFPEQIEYTTTVIGAGLPAVFRDLL